MRQYGPRIVGAGKDLLIVSVGALADPELRATLIDEGPGRTFISNGAIGGLDLLRGVAIKGGLARVELVTRKLPGTLVQPWMDDEEASRLRATEHPVTVFEGSVTEDELREMYTNFNVTQAFLVEGKMHVRVYLADGKAPSGFSAVPATLEDAFFLMMSSTGAGDSACRAA